VGEREPENMQSGHATGLASGSIGEPAEMQTGDVGTRKRLSRHFFRDFCHHPNKNMRASVEEVAAVAE